MNKTLTTIMASCLLAAGAGAQEIPLDTPARGFSYSLGLQTGANIISQLPQAADDINLDAMMLGIRDRLQKHPQRLDVAEITFWSGKFLAMLEDREKLRQEANLETGAKFREAYGQREGVTTTSGGVLYRELRPGSGRQPGIGQSVRLHVRGTLIDGREFDDSRARGEPHLVRVRELRDGLQEVVTLMPAGAVWEAVIPPELAYGEAGKGEIGPNETLIYEIELLGIE